MTTPKHLGVQIWQINLLWPMDPPVSEQKCLEYQYTKLGRWTYFGWWTPPVPEERWLHITTQNLAYELTLANGPPSTRTEMTSIPLHKTWQMNLVWPMDPLEPSREWLAFHYTKRGRWNDFGWTQWQRFESSSIHCFLDIPTAFSQNTFLLTKWLFSFLELQISLPVCFKGCWTQWQSFESSSIHRLWDTPQHFLKTHFSLESGFLSFLELQKSLPGSFQGCWTQWQKFESSTIHHFWNTPQHFLKTHFCCESGFLLFLELQKSLLVNFQGAEHHGDSSEGFSAHFCGFWRDKWGNVH